MKFNLGVIALVLVGGINGFCRAQSPSVSGRHIKEIEGWTVLVSDALMADEKAATERALELLSDQLREINLKLPRAAVAELHKVPLWISPEYPDVTPRAEYHPGARWLSDHHRDPAMAKAVEFTNVRIFERETQRMPNFALHELAHAFHDRVLPKGFRNPEVKSAFERAKASGMYDQVEQRFGDGRSATVRAYAMTNPEEFFAECSEAYFSTNDFFPFTRDQLAKVDPETCELLRRLWGAATETSDGAAGEFPAVEKAADPSKLTLDRIFSSAEFRGERLAPNHWLADGATVMLQPSKSLPDSNDIVRVDARNELEVLVSAEQLVPSGATDPLSIEGFDLTIDLDVVLIYTNSVKVWRQNTRGDYWLFRRSNRKLKRLGGDAPPSTLMFAKISPDGNRVAYVRDNNLYVESTDGDGIVPLTKDGSEQIINGTFDWVYEEEFSCRDGWRWSPDSQHIAYWQLDTTGVQTFTLVDYTTQRYPILKTFAYPKTGQRNSACRIGVVSVAGGQTRWIPVPGDTRTDYYLPKMEWADNSQELVIQRANRLQNTVDVLLANAATGELQMVLTEVDETWVDINDDAVDWIANGNAFTWISERDGWRHLYLSARDGSSLRKVTHGDFDVIRVLCVDEGSNRVYFLASPDNPTQQYLFSTALDGRGSLERLTPADQPGTHDYDIANDATHAIHTYSAFGMPPRVEVVTLPEHQVLRTLVANERLRQNVDQLARSPVEFFRVEIGGDSQLDGWMIKPPDFDPQKKYPLMFHVYGEPAAQSVRDRWGGDQYLWHLMLAQQGYVVACVDNRGTPCPRGRSWRKAAYRRVGTLASQDQVAAARQLLQRPYLDPNRVGAWGWSGGGSMTLNLLFRYPDVYHTGMAVAAVPDMSLYDTIYQERYMGLPQEHPEDYRDGSPITHAQGLRGDLLLVHGSGDDNCHQQGMEKLVNRLVELNKSFAMMSYPNRSHSINEGPNTTRHLYGLLTQFLTDHLRAGPSVE